MKRIMVLILMTTLFLVPMISFAEDDQVTVLGRILEMVLARNMIQVGDRNYIVEKVVIDDGSEEEPILGGILDLRVGNIVRIYVGEKEKGFWKAEKVVLFVGEKREELLRDLE